MYHLTPAGEARPCSASSSDSCPYEASDHFVSKEAARSEYEERMKTQQFDDVAVTQLSHSVEKLVASGELTEYTPSRVGDKAYKTELMALGKNQFGRRVYLELHLNKSSSGQWTGEMRSLVTEKGQRKPTVGPARLEAIDTVHYVFDGDYSQDGIKGLQELGLKMSFGRPSPQELHRATNTLLKPKETLF